MLSHRAPCSLSDLFFMIPTAERFTHGFCPRESSSGEVEAKKDQWQSHSRSPHLPVQFHAFHPSALCPSWQKTFYCRTFAPAQPTYSAASLRDFLSGALTRHRFRTSSEPLSIGIMWPKPERPQSLPTEMCGAPSDSATAVDPFISAVFLGSDVNSSVKSSGSCTYSDWQ